MPDPILSPSGSPACSTDVAPAMAEWAGVGEESTSFEQTFQSLAKDAPPKRPSAAPSLVTGTPAAGAELPGLLEQVFSSPTTDGDTAEKETVEVDQSQTLAGTIPAEWAAVGLVLPIIPIHIVPFVAHAAPASDTAVVSPISMMMKGCSLPVPLASVVGSFVLPSPASGAKSPMEGAPVQEAALMVPEIQPPGAAGANQRSVQAMRPAMSSASQTWEDFARSPQRAVKQSAEVPLGGWVRTSEDSVSGAGLSEALPAIDREGDVVTVPLKPGGNPPPLLVENSPLERVGELFSSRGMAGANFTQQMINAEDKDPVASSAKQTLPEPATSGVVSADSSARRPILSEPLKKAGPGIESFFGVDSAAASSRSTFPTEELMVRETRAAEPAAALLDELQSELTHAVYQLKRLRTDSMSVVLRPDANTELELQVNLRNGIVDVDAHFKRGSSDLIQSQWEQLQQNLSQQGIRVGPLQETSLGSGSPGHGSTPFRERPTAMEDFMPAPAGAAPNPRPLTNQAAPLPRTTNDQLWESWA